MHPVARIDDAPSGRRSIIVVLNEGEDAYAYEPFASRRDLELVAELWGLNVADVDTTEVDDVLT